MRLLKLANGLAARCAIGLAILWLFFAPGQAPAQSPPEAVPGELLVGLKPGGTGAVQAVGASVQGFGGQVIDQIPELNLVKIRVPENSAQGVATTLSASPYVDYVEDNVLYEMTLNPNDPQWPEQWGPAKIKVPQAWDLERGDKSILVAVVDSGVDYRHPDIRPNYVAKGRDLVEGDDDPFPSGQGSGVSHGTHVAGIIAAALNNRTGIAGVAQVSLMAVRVLDETGHGTSFNIAQGIVHAVKAKAHIINLSLGAPRAQRAIESAVDYAVEHGSLVIAAAGNTGKNQPFYPAAFEGAVAVSATDRNDRLWSLSTYGSQIELAAPGVDILSTVPGEKFAWMRGTSMAAPHVAGVAALIWSRNPDLTHEQVRQLLCDTADDLGPRGRDSRFGCGRVNALEAVKAARSRPSQPPSPLALAVDAGCGGNYDVGDEVTVTFTVNESASVSVYRLGPGASLQLLALRTAGANARQTLPAFTAERAGVDTIVLQAETVSGRVLTKACTYSVGGVSLEKARLSLDRGCDAVYHIGEPITMSLSVEKASDVSVIDFATDGSISEILQFPLDAKGTRTVEAQVVGPPGIDTLVMIAQTASGTVITSACSLTIQP